MSKIKINFTDFWPGIEEDNFFLDFMKKHFPVTIDPRPDYLFYSVYSQDHLSYGDCVKICYTGENLVPDFNLCDYALGFHYLEFGDRYLRFPLYVIYPGYVELGYKSLGKEEELLQRKFCNFVYSNATYADPNRKIFFDALSKYKRVDAGGRFLNNIGGPVPNKLAFIKDYKFTIAFENSSVPGYSTEKIMEPMRVNSVPIYYGNPMVERDFNIESFVNVPDMSAIDEVIERVIALDQDDELYLEMLRKPWLGPENTFEVWEQKLYNFLSNIFQQPLAEAKRKPDFGYNRYYTDSLLFQRNVLDQRYKINQIKSNIKGFLGLKNTYQNGQR